MSECRALNINAYTMALELTDEGLFHFLSLHVAVLTLANKMCGTLLGLESFNGKVMLKCTVGPLYPQMVFPICGLKILTTFF